MHGPTDRHKRRENPRQPVVVIAAKEQRGERTIGGVGQNGRDRGGGKRERDAINRNEFKIQESNVRNPGCNLFSDPRINGRLHAQHRTIRNGRRFGFQNINDSIPPAISCNYSASGLVSRFKHENRARRAHSRQESEFHWKFAWIGFSLSSLSHHSFFSFLFFFFFFFILFRGNFPLVFRFRWTKSLQERGLSGAHREYRHASFALIPARHVVRIKYKSNSLPNCQAALLYEYSNACARNSDRFKAEIAGRLSLFSEYQNFQLFSLTLLVNRREVSILVVDGWNCLKSAIKVTSNGTLTSNEIFFRLVSMAFCSIESLLPKQVIFQICSSMNDRVALK